MKKLSLMLFTLIAFGSARSQVASSLHIDAGLAYNLNRTNIMQEFYSENPHWNESIPQNINADVFENTYALQTGMEWQSNRMLYGFRNSLTYLGFTRAFDTGTSNYPIRVDIQHQNLILEHSGTLGWSLIGGESSNFPEQRFSAVARVIAGISHNRSKIEQVEREQGGWSNTKYSIVLSTITAAAEIGLQFQLSSKASLTWNTGYRFQDYGFEPLNINDYNSPGDLYRFSSPSFFQLFSSNYHPRPDFSSIYSCVGLKLSF